MTDKKSAVQKAKGFKDDFLKFALKGNMIDLAVGVVIGAAFGAIVNSLVNDIIMPLLSPIIGRLDYSKLFFAMDGNTYDSIEAAAEAGVALLKYGNFLTLVINFLIVAFSIFLVVRWLGRLRRKQEPAPAPAPASKKCPYCLMEVPVGATRCGHCTSQLS